MARTSKFNYTSPHPALEHVPTLVEPISPSTFLFYKHNFKGFILIP